MTLDHTAYRLGRVVLVAAALLMVPLVAMQFSGSGVVWTFADFAVAGTLLLGAGFAYELVARKGGSATYRAAAGLACATALFLVWSNLAVGLIGSEDNPANLMYLGVVAVLAAGAAIARFQPRGMARALFATAVAQVLVPAIALTAGMYVPNLPQVAVLTAFFAALFAGSALLFRRAAARN